MQRCSGRAQGSVALQCAGALLPRRVGHKARCEQHTVFAQTREEGAPYSSEQGDLRPRGLWEGILGSPQTRALLSAPPWEGVDLVLQRQHGRCYPAEVQAKDASAVCTAPSTLETRARTERQRNLARATQAGGGRAPTPSLPPWQGIASPRHSWACAWLCCGICLGPCASPRLPRGVESGERPHPYPLLPLSPAPARGAAGS